MREYRLEPKTEIVHCDECGEWRRCPTSCNSARCAGYDKQDGALGYCIVGDEWTPAKWGCEYEVM